ncbi:MAG: hypothetical protein QOE03_2193 [Micromonosporaceae bacterium]|nr:hypothetical protein [Micromonosporaceae bacterium]
MSTEHSHDSASAEPPAAAETADNSDDSATVATGDGGGPVATGDSGPVATGEADGVTTGEAGSASAPPTTVATVSAAATPTVAEVADAEPVDPWHAFGPAAGGQPGLFGRWAGRTGRLLGHEWLLASVLGLLVSIAMTWPSALRARDTIPEDLGDPQLVTWILAWPGHAVTTDVTKLWHANPFYPDRYSFAFTDSLLGYLPASLIGSGWGAAIVRYNVLFIFAFALASVGAYALVRQLGAGRLGAAVAGVAFAYAPWRYSQAGHLHILSSGGIVLALAMLARGHGLSLRDSYRRDRVRPVWALAGWLVAGWQITIGFGIGIVFGYLLAGCVLVGLVAWLWRRWRLPRRLVMFDLAGMLVFGGVTAFMLYPYLKVLSIYRNATRSLADVALYSPPPRGLLVAPPESLLWGDVHATVRGSLPSPAEMTLLPGFALYGLAVAGLVISAWSVRARILLMAGVVVSMICALGTHGPFDGWLGYTALYHLPGFNALRTPGRLIMVTTLLLGILAAGALTDLSRRGVRVRGNRVPGRPETFLRIAMVIPLALVVLEGVNTMPHPIAPPPPAGFGKVAGPLVILPQDEHTDPLYMAWSTEGYVPMVNGLSGFTPRDQVPLRTASSHFPDPGSIAQLRAAGIRSVVVLRNRVTNQALLTAPVDELGIRRDDRGEMIVYTLSP